MAEYTIELGNLIQLGWRPALTAYPIFDESHREELNNKIVEHYWFREIGQETPDRFNLFLQRKMNEIMPYYNEMYRSVCIQYDPLATDYYSRSVNNDLAKETETTISERRKSGETVGDVYTENKDDKNISNAQGTSDTTTHSERIGNTKEDTTYSKDGTEDVTRTEQTKDNASEGVVSDSLTTNNLLTETNSNTEGSGTNDTTGGKLTATSDLPQSSVEISVGVDGSGTSRQSVSGYATTAVNEATAQHDKTTTTESSDSTAKNTGTIDVHATTDTTREATGNRDGTEDKNWTEKGTSGTIGKEDETDDGTAKVSTTEKSDSYTNLKTDAERNTARNENIEGERSDNQRQLQNTQEEETAKGRRGFIPADLIAAYRKAIINVDLLIIEELEPLFMGVF